MFTGIVETTSRVMRTQNSSGVKAITIELPKSFNDLKKGSSIACDGICLTVTQLNTDSFNVEIMQETVQKTTAGNWNKGTILNLERALKLEDHLDGHLVLGHIDRTTTLLEKKTISATTYLRFSLDSRDRELVVKQGSVALNGVSLTVAELNSSSFTVALISYTLDTTNLRYLSPGANVNLEYDIIGKYIQNLYHSSDFKNKL
ncbi:MAG TPA: riboflavin synthase [Candidatus Syntrophosphaera thermopropionivorans]|nr:riboflavin synthase [Candidatus Syntrophosphaera thermopropionivorans]